MIKYTHHTGQLLPLQGDLTPEEGVSQLYSVPVRPHPLGSPTLGDIQTNETDGKSLSSSLVGGLETVVRGTL